MKAFDSNQKNFFKKSKLNQKKIYNSLIDLSLKKKSLNLNKISSKKAKFNAYIAGLIEGDGGFYISLKKSRGKIIDDVTCRISIVFHTDDKPYAKFLQKRIGGRIHKIKNKDGTFANAVRLVITALKDVVKLCKRVNGYLRTPKIKAFLKFVYCLNKYKKQNIKVLPLDKSSIDSNPWLSGFSDADACFYAYVTDPLDVDSGRVKGLSISLDFAIVLKRYYGKNSIEKITQVKNETAFNSFTFICEKINRDLGDHAKVSHQIRKIKDKKTKETTSFPCVRVRFTNQQGRQAVSDYFSRFPLFSSKFLNCRDWCYLNKLHRNKVHLTSKGFLECFSIRSNMNTRRTSEITWDHLDNFYV